MTETELRALDVEFAEKVKGLVVPVPLIDRGDEPAQGSFIIVGDDLEPLPLYHSRLDLVWAAVWPRRLVRVRLDQFDTSGGGYSNAFVYGGSGYRLISQVLGETRGPAVAVMKALLEVVKAE